MVFWRNLALDRQAWTLSRIPMASREDFIRSHPGIFEDGGYFSFRFIIVFHRFLLELGNFHDAKEYQHVHTKDCDPMGGLIQDFNASRSAHLQ
ncbi:hypothetical protein CEXT_764681 [Caerostris extrusa]|uniref:Uncharacterized protein n=1 Tax=Caerostris extrusa TaxID=172846 RepID=A0AAV4N293_CAEEX|nr:hypothetical protein CEXT_764681 [Caerostris extrusa]